MKKEVYSVYFTNGRYPAQEVVVKAVNKESAAILAQAERIKAGLDYTMHYIHRGKL